MIFIDCVGQSVGNLIILATFPSVLYIADIQILVIANMVGHA